MAFPLFDAGKNARDVVVELKVDPATARRLYEEWSDLGGDRLVSRLDWKQLEAVFGQELTQRDLVSLVVLKVQYLLAWVKRLTYPCSRCGGPVPLDEGDWEHILESGVLDDRVHIKCP